MLKNLITAAFIVLLGCGSVSAGQPVVDAPQGRVAGFYINNVEAFLGIPYAAPPVDALRWAPPQPAPEWKEETFQAVDFGADCMQEPIWTIPAPGYEHQDSEDCLCLNIWRPFEAKPGDKLPVMVWIHGGAFIMGAGSFPQYDGREFAKSGVIFLSLNYRLGRFGVFAHPALNDESAESAPVNFGMMDQIAALEWVKGNIESFGGDPENVTIFGESAGAASVNFLMTSPATDGLFQRAISQSGGLYHEMLTYRDAEMRGKEWTQSLGLSDDVSAEDLRALPAETVLRGPEPVMVPWPPVIDDDLIPMNTAEAFRDGKFHDVDYLLGANGFEESLIFWLPGAEETFFETLDPDNGAHLLDMYFADGLADEKAAKSRLWGEAAMVLPTAMRARDVARAGGDVWLYHFAYTPEMRRDEIAGAMHEGEIEMVFKNDMGRYRHFWTEKDLQIADLMHDYWVNFARTGNPNGENGFVWPEYDLAAKAQLHITNDDISVVEDYASDRFEVIEEEIMPLAGAGAE